MDKHKTLSAFCDFLARMDDITRANVERAWNAQPRFANGRNWSSAVWEACELGYSNDQRAEARSDTMVAAGNVPPVSWAAANAANEIQAAYDEGVKKGLRRFFFLPMFGFDTPEKILPAI